MKTANFLLVSYNGKYNRLMSDESEFDSQHEHTIINFNL